MAKNQVPFIFLKSVFSCVFCQCFSSVGLSGGEAVQEKTGSLRFSVISCNSYSLAGLCSGSKAEDEQCFFKLIQHQESLYTERHCKVV